jgi:hypothetical protein
VGVLRLLSGYPPAEANGRAQGQDDADSLGSSVGSKDHRDVTCVAGRFRNQL